MSEVANLERLIVVGIDGSSTSKDALRWAARQAELTGASLQAVTTWHLPVFIYGPGVLPFPADLDLGQESRLALDQIVTEVLGDHPKVKISTLVIEGHPAVQLLKAAEHAELLVVGSRGHGAYAGMLLGSVSEHCVTHSPCPVVVIRHTDESA